MRLMGKVIGKVCTLVGYSGKDFYTLLVDDSGIASVTSEGRASHPMISNVVMDEADTEYYKVFSGLIHKFLIKCEGLYPIEICFVPREYDTDYITIPAGQTYWEDGLTLNGFVIYMQCPVAGQVAQIVCWRE